MGITPHDLRHTVASLAVQAGADVKAVQLILGHASAAMVLQPLRRPVRRRLDAVADRLDAAAALARADYLRTERPNDAALPFDLGGRVPPHPART